jgi:hypothetical protein
MYPDDHITKQKYLAEAAQPRGAVDAAPPCSRSDTPETDAECRKTGHDDAPASYLHADFARKLERERDRYRKALEEIAAQFLSDEMDDDTSENADWEGGYEAIVKIARAALSPENARAQQPAE